MHPQFAEIQNHIDKVCTALKVSAGGNILACAFSSHTPQIVDLRINQKIGSRLEGHTGSVKCITMNEEGTIAVTGSADNTIKVWDIGMPMSQNNGKFC